jgi:hypothetical protein
LAAAPVSHGAQLIKTRQTSNVDNYQMGQREFRTGITVEWFESRPGDSDLPWVRVTDETSQGE